MTDIDAKAFGAAWIAARTTRTLAPAQPYLEADATFEGEAVADWLAGSRQAKVTLEVRQVFAGATGLNVLYRSSDGRVGIDSFRFGSAGLIESGWTTS